MRDFLAELNNEQREAAETLNGYVRIIAGAGTGKTKTLISRTANLMAHGVAPENILLLTFTKKAAKEMQDRLARFFPDGSAEKVKATTFHSFCAEELRKYATFCGFGHNFDIRDMDDMKIIVRDILEPYRGNYPVLKKRNVKLFPTSNQILDIYSAWRNSMGDLLSIVEDVEDLDSSCHKLVLQIIDEYVSVKQSKNIMDYDDLLYYFHKLLSEHTSICNTISREFEYIMCDEYQDTNVIQDAILNLLSVYFGNLCVVGDDNQSIYAFRYANVENIIDFEQNHYGCKSITLIQNYRSSCEILDASNAVMKHATTGIKKMLHGTFHGNRPVIVSSANCRAQAKWICRMIKAKHEQGLPLREMAVMVRNANLSVDVELECRKQDIPFKKYGGSGFFQQKGVKDILAFCRASVNDTDEISWKRILTLHPGIAVKASGILFDLVKQNGKDALIGNDVQGKKYTAWLTLLHSLFEQAKSLSPAGCIHLFGAYYQKLEEFVIKNMSTSEDVRQEKYDQLSKTMSQIMILEDLAQSYRFITVMLDDFVLNVPEKEENKDVLNITTIHSAKGLEYDTVFLVNPIDGIFPSYMDVSELPEELRCLYVAMTRPKQELFVCVPDEIIYLGRHMSCSLSSDLNKSDVLRCFRQIRV